ncbi:spore germination protein [Paenibacillus sp. OV219]|uniref:spore germination protein n=1 Tax=Paenibacillus sp. OV219 TaxID=1884377 RepID=UPI0011609445
MFRVLGCCCSDRNNGWPSVDYSNIHTYHNAMLKSFTVPYLSPLIPFKPQELRDVFYRSNLKKLINSENSYTRRVKR